MKRLSSSKAIVALVVCLIVFSFFIPNLLFKKIPIPADIILGLYHPWRDVVYDGFNPGRFPTKNPLISDPVLQTYPWRYLVIENIKGGRLPLWNPYSFSGQPLMANIQSATFSIFNILFFVLNFKVSWALQVILPSIFAGLFMFYFLSDLKLSKVSSVFGAITLPFTGFFIAWLTWGSIIATVMWLPLILLLIRRIKINNSSPIWFIALVFAISQIFLSGHWQAGIYVFATSFLYLIYLSIHLSFKKFWIIITALILGILISSIQILPSLEFLGQSARNVDQNYYPGRQDWFLPLKHLVQFIAPDFFGNPARYNYWGVWNYGEFVGFVGILPLFFAISQIIRGRNKSGFFILLLIISLLFATDNPISKIPYVLNLPFFSTIQPSRIIFLIDFSLVVLAVFGLEYFLKEKRKKIWILSAVSITITLSFLYVTTLFLNNSSQSPQNVDISRIAARNLVFPSLTFIALIFLLILKFQRVNNKIIIASVFLIVITELFRFGYRFTPFSKTSLIFPTTELIEYLKIQKKPFRVLTTDRRILHPNTSAIYGIESVDGYDPLYSKKYNKFVSAWLSQNPQADTSSFNRIVTPQKFDSPLIDLLNVEYVLTFDELNDPKFTKVLSEGETKLYKNDFVLPRAFFVQKVSRVENDGEELAKLLDPNFDRANLAVSQDFEIASSATIAKVEIETYNDQSILISTLLDKPAPLIITNSSSPGWHAYLDSQEIPIYEVDYLFQSAIVPAGEHKILLTYIPKSFYYGVYLSLASIVVTFLITLILWRLKSL